MRFGQDVLASILPFRALALWARGYPDAALADVDRVVKHAREINHAASLMLALSIGSLTYIYCGRYAEASKLSDEVVALADEKGIAGFKGLGMADRGWISASTGDNEVRKMGARAIAFPSSTGSLAAGLKGG